MLRLSWPLIVLATANSWWDDWWTYDGVSGTFFLLLFITSLTNPIDTNLLRSSASRLPNFQWGFNKSNQKIRLVWHLKTCQF